MALVIDNLRDMVAKLTGREVKMRYLEDFACVMMSFDKRLPKSPEESVDEAWERNRGQA